ncbi:hypothetical protein ES702_06800 [subsurface metagenome]
MEKTVLAKAQKHLENFQQGAPTAGESAIAWALIGIAENLGRIATALEEKRR